MVKDQNLKGKTGKDMSRHFTQKNTMTGKQKRLFMLTYNGNAHRNDKAMEKQC